MKARDERDAGGIAVDELERAELLERPVTPAGDVRPLAPTAGLVIGELVAMTDDGQTPLVLYPGQPGTAAIRAAAVVDLHAAHIGRQVVLGFEGERARPIVIGILQADRLELTEAPGSVSVEADGERMIVSAKDQLVLQCGKASITLTKAGKVLIRGEYISSRSSGVNRLKGGSIQLN